MAQLDAMQPEPTMWEVVRRLDELASGQKEIKESLDDKYVRKDVYEAEGETKEKISDNTKQRLGILESRHEWMIRLVASTFFMSSASLVVEYFRIRAH
jgi:hypothetical protein